jgi:small multidrug resistance pump
MEVHQPRSEAKTSPDAALARYRPWFYAAAFYNLVWGSVNVLFPSLLFETINMPAPNHLALWQVVGMFVLIYAPAYWWAARRPAKHRHLVLIGFLGKLFGPVGYLWAISVGALPVAFGWTIIFNDVVWWPAFALYTRDAARAYGGVVRLLSGE